MIVMWNLHLPDSDNNVQGRERCVNTNNKVDKHWDKDTKVWD